MCFMAQNDPSSNDIPKKTPAFFPAKSARSGSKECHQKDILKLKPNLSMKILPTIIATMVNLAAKSLPALDCAKNH